MSGLSGSRQGELAALPGKLYTPAAMTSRRTCLIALAILVAVFVALYPSLGAMNYCDHGECPYVAQSSSTASASLMAACVSAVLAMSSAVVLALAAFHGRRIALTQPRPENIFISPDPYPPRLSF